VSNVVTGRLIQYDAVLFDVMIWMQAAERGRWGGWRDAE